MNLKDSKPDVIEIKGDSPSSSSFFKLQRDLNSTAILRPIVLDKKTTIVGADFDKTFVLSHDYVSQLLGAAGSKGKTIEEMKDSLPVR